MSRIFMDGFESGNFGLWSSIHPNATINNSLSGRTGNYCLNFSNASHYITKILPSDDEYYFSMKLNFTDMSSLKGIINLYEGAILHLQIYASQLGVINIKKAGSVLANSSVGVFTSVTWYLIEFYVKIADTEGRCVVKVNGITYIDFTGDTRNAGTSGVINSIKIGYDITDEAVYSYYYLDDVIIDDANWIGSSSIQGLAVTGAGTTTQFDPSTGSNYACVDEIPPSDADYISTNVANEIDTYACGNLTGTINSVKAVQVQARCMQEGSPAVPKIQLVTRPTSTDRVSASKSVQTFAPGVASNIWELNPDDSAAWEAADVNGMEIGVKAVAS